ncbi:MAG: HPr family phosphocarrier protein [Agathobacter sp.]|nr:HPr family phosphocarrier protein [Agathobacter sp.]
MKSFTYVIKDELGIHARPAGLLVNEAKKFSCDITIKCGGKSNSCKGIMGVMALAAKKGNEVTVECNGADEDDAAKTLKAFFESTL